MEEKEHRGLKSVDATIKALLDEAGHKAEDVLEPTSEEEPPEAAQKRRKINVQEPLYELEALCKRPGMLEYYTGLDRSQFDMLLERLSEVRNGLLLFVVLSFWL
jgi:hypothetical protein